MSQDFNQEALLPVLQEKNLIAFLVNEGWLLIRRKEYIDVFIEDEPFNSVQVLFCLNTKVRKTLFAEHFCETDQFLSLISENHRSCVGENRSRQG